MALPGRVSFDLHDAFEDWFSSKGTTLHVGCVSSGLWRGDLRINDTGQYQVAGVDPWSNDRVGHAILYLEGHFDTEILGASTGDQVHVDYELVETAEQLQKAIERFALMIAEG